MATRDARHQETIQKVVISLTSLALNCPSTFTIAWSKAQHPEELPILYAGIASSLITVAGALLNDSLMWIGLASSIALFAYTVLFYQSPIIAQGGPLIIGSPKNEILVI